MPDCRSTGSSDWLPASCRSCPSISLLLFSLASLFLRFSFFSIFFIHFSVWFAATWLFIFMLNCFLLRTGAFHLHKLCQSMLKRKRKLYSTLISCRLQFWAKSRAKQAVWDTRESSLFLSLSLFHSLSKLIKNCLNEWAITLHNWLCKSTCTSCLPACLPGWLDSS